MAHGQCFNPQIPNEMICFPGSSAEWVDSTGVDVHEFLINVLRTCARDRTILLKIEHDMTSFVNDKS